MPFKSGPDNPTVQRALYVKQKRVQRKTQKAERQREVELGVRIVPGFTPAKSVYAPRNPLKKGLALAEQVLALHARGGGTQTEIAYKRDVPRGRCQPSSPASAGLRGIR